MTAAKTVTATFTGGITTGGTQTLTLVVRGQGSVGTCHATGGTSICRRSYPTGASVSLTAVPLKGQKFKAWSGGCTGSATKCSLKMTAAKSVTANFTGFSAAAGSGLQLTSVGRPTVTRLGSRFLVTVSFDSSRDGTANLEIFRGNMPVSTITFSGVAGPNSFGPFLLPRAGVYSLVLVFVDLTGHTRTLRWDACLGVKCPAATTKPTTPSKPTPPTKPTKPTTPPTTPPSTGTLKLAKGAAKIEKLATGANVTLNFSTNSPITVTVDIFKSGKNVLHNLKFTFKTGPVALGPFTVTEKGTYTFNLSAVDKSGHKAALTWTVTV
jgi:hypothetical protein